MMTGKVGGFACSRLRLAKKGYRHLAECNGMYKLNSFIKSKGQNSRSKILPSFYGIKDVSQ